MTATALTEAGIGRLAPAPAGTRYDKPDRLALGLFLRVNAAGLKTWMCQYRLAGGKQSKVALGYWPAMGVAEARVAARKVREDAAAGIHPKAAAEQATRAKAAEAEQAQAHSFAVLADEFIAAMRAGRLVGGKAAAVSAEEADRRASMLHRVIVPALGAMAVDAVRQQDIARMLNKIERTGGPVDRALQVTRLAFRFAAARGLLSGPLPTAGLGRRQAPTGVGRALTGDELKALWSAAGRAAYPYGMATRLLMLSGARREEVGAARWTDVDFARGLIRVGSERFKGRRLHEIVLSPPAVAVLREAEAAYNALGLTSGFIFANRFDTGPINGWEKVSAKLERDAALILAGASDDDLTLLRSHWAQGPAARARKAELAALAAKTMVPFRVHDIRQTVVTRLREGEMNAEGEVTFAVPLDVVQMVAGHKLSVGVTGIYDHGDLQVRYRRRKLDAVNWWARKLMAIVEPGSERGAEVVTLARAY